VPTLSVNTLGAGAFAHFYAVNGQPPVIDSIPIPIQQVTAALGSGTPGYSSAASTGQPSNAPLYSPIWEEGRGDGGTGGRGARQSQSQRRAGLCLCRITPSPRRPVPPSVFQVTFNPGVAPLPLRSVQDIQQAVAVGLVTVAAGRPDDTFNCPVPFFYQPGG
jgi:hypothetical protein